MKILSGTRILMPVVKPIVRRFEAPWRFLGGIPINDPNDLRRIMAYLHVALNPIIPPAYDGPELTLANLSPNSSSERAEIESRIKIMIEEAEQSPLLYIMLSWYGYLCDACDEKVLAATKVIQDYATFPVRHRPNLYWQEYAVARKDWDEWLVAFKRGKPKFVEEDVEMEDWDTEATTEIEFVGEEDEDEDEDSEWEP